MEKNEKHFLKKGEVIFRCDLCGRVLVACHVPQSCPGCGGIDSFSTVAPERY